MFTDVSMPVNVAAL